MLGAVVVQVARAITGLHNGHLRGGAWRGEGGEGRCRELGSKGGVVSTAGGDEGGGRPPCGILSPWSVTASLTNLVGLAAPFESITWKVALVCASAEQASRAAPNTEVCASVMLIDTTQSLFSVTPICATVAWSGWPVPRLLQKVGVAAPHEACTVLSAAKKTQRTRGIDSGTQPVRRHRLLIAVVVLDCRVSFLAPRSQNKRKSPPKKSPSRWWQGRQGRRRRSERGR